MPADLLERASARNIKFYQLFGEDRAELRGCLVRVAGQLRLLRGYDPPVGLKNDDRPLELMYEAWIFDADAGSNPCCVVFSELPEGLQVFESKPNEREYPFVEADAFLFKRYRYGARDAAREAPFLMARTIRVAKPAMARSPTANPWDVPTSVILTTLGLIGLAALGMGTMVLWFRRDDARARARLRRSAPSAFHDREPENPFSDRGPMGGSPSLN